MPPRPPPPPVSPNRCGATSRQRSQRAHRWRCRPACRCEAPSRSAAGCPSGLVRSWLRCVASCGPPGWPGSSPAPTPISMGAAPWSGSSPGSSPWPRPRVPTSRAVQPGVAAPRSSGSRPACSPGSVCDGPPRPTRRSLPHTTWVTRALEVRCQLDHQGRPRSITFDRWGDPDQTGTWGWCRSGGEFSAYRTFDGVTIPSEGRFGWFYGTNRWADGEFFRYRITQLTLTR